jgi:hypothetical protein
MPSLRYRAIDHLVRLRTTYLSDVAFVHINKTGGSSIEAALNLPFQHRTARELRELIGERRWAARFSFAFVRNPWDKVASHYHYRVKTNQTGLGERRVDFNDWIRLAYGEHDPRYYDNPKMFMPQLDWITDDAGQVLVDFVGRFERLHDDFEEVCRQVGRTSRLPHLKRSVDKDYRKLYSPEAAGIVSSRFAADIDHFGYSFDRPHAVAEGTR